MILDTNVLSELMRGDPTNVITMWLDTHSRTDLTIAAVTVQETTFGLARMPEGARRDRLEGTWLLLWGRLALNVLPCDADVATQAGRLSALHEKSGKHLGLADAQIGATALVHRVPLATRNTKDFEGLGIELVNPWDHITAD